MLYDATVPQFTKMLTNLSRFFDKAAAWGEARKFDPETLLSARLAPDMLPLTRQVLIACDTAKLGVARITGKEPPKHDDTEKTIGELRNRIEQTISYLATFERKDFEGAETRRISQPRWNGKSLSGEQYALQHMIPNFYFHVATAYAILRHNGVDVGKQDYLGPMPFQE